VRTCARQVVLERIHGRGIGHVPHAWNVHDHGQRLDDGLPHGGDGHGAPFNATTPAVDAQRRRIAHESGRLIVQMARSDVRLSKILTRSAFENAIRLLSAIGGSTNAVIHLLAFAGRLGVPLELADFDRLSADIPLLVDLQPSGRFLMETCITRAACRPC